MSFLLYLGSLPNGLIPFGGFIKHWRIDDFQISIYSQSYGPLAACNFWSLIDMNYIEIKISSTAVTAKFVMLRSETCKWLFYKTAEIWKLSNDRYVSSCYSTSTVLQTPQAEHRTRLLRVFLESFLSLEITSRFFWLLTEKSLHWPLAFLQPCHVYWQMFIIHPEQRNLVEISLKQHFHNGFLFFTSTFTSLWYIFHEIVKVIFEKIEKERNQNETFLWNGSNPSKSFPIQD